ALVGNPLLLVADEPTGNLDTKRSNEIMDLLCALNEERKLTILMVTHEPDIARFAKRVMLFVDGHLVKDGSPDEVLS
ncbi:MAG: macrolide ABC transporter ATP-binding protein, partial [Myxococcota bacterium]|nr:macrolide ABC transporter ATP-binding protein [Myxococcota bacterium]